METMVGWLRSRDNDMLVWMNRRPVNRGIQRLLGWWLHTITHTGGASFTLATALCGLLLLKGSWSAAGAQALFAVIVSHIPVAIVKRKIKRLRPYQRLPHLNICKKPLLDPSFPSGHTTAIFAWLMPWLLVDTTLLIVLLPAALLLGLSVAWSRMYLGLHYPSDVAAGAVLGSLAGALSSSLWSFI
ncbi:undecaprenyl-diphosphatase [Paenibacillus phyllosphaerae]|uniref:Undecaprenyl-diphosphatase n=1 Tax=Paenibacillus phyllosphaerae TaxID=274593 RepID=A0A7W5FL76_9BACL|nr:phosphatase PAP2 family protein [Paenibacillus phyllosphaerae]MBB3108702.1 undecaprenyl-diphosphatase [Paenibacillus phyllosphaerae]